LFGYKMNRSFYAWTSPLFTFKTQFYWSRNYMLFVFYSCNCVYKHSIKLFPSSFLDQCKPWELFLPGRGAAEGVKGDRWAGLLKPFFFCSTTRVIFNSFPFVFPLAFVIVVTLEDDDDGDGGLAYWNHFPLFCFPLVF